MGKTTRLPNLIIYMKNIRDLHFKDEIIPLFDFVNNEFSRDVLIQLLSEVPDSLEEVLWRQDILKGFLGNEQLYRPFSYARSELNEVYSFIRELREKNNDLQNSSLKMELLFGRVKRQKERGRLSQLLIFFHKIHHAYFSSIRTDAFPGDFKNKLEKVRRMFSDLEIEKHEPIVRKQGLTMTETRRLVRLLDEKIRVGEMDDFWKDLFLFEAWLSISKGIRKHRFVFPLFKDQGLSLTEFYHPLLKQPVKNTLTVKENVTLITGPNMSGKSILLKAICLCVYLGHLGLAVPAEKCELSFFEVISIAIDLNDDIRSGYSHFMTEIKNLKAVVSAARDGKKCFAIFDELFRGTNAEDALAISKTTIEGLTRFPHSCFFISTHLYQLRDRIAKDRLISARYIECNLVNELPVFTYKLRDGWSDLKIGQIIFEQEGLHALLSYL